MKKEMKNETKEKEINIFEEKNKVEPEEKKEIKYTKKILKRETITW